MLRNDGKSLCAVALRRPRPRRDARPGRGLGGVSLREIAVQDREIRDREKTVRPGPGNQQRADDGIGRIGMDDGGRLAVILDRRGEARLAPGGESLLDACRIVGDGLVELVLDMEDEFDIATEIVLVGQAGEAASRGRRAVACDQRGLVDRDFEAVEAVEVGRLAELRAILLGGTGTEIDKIWHGALRRSSLIDAPHPPPLSCRVLSRRRSGA